MAMPRKRIPLDCPVCKKSFEIIQARVDKASVHCCSLSCASILYWNKKRKYPKAIGKCKYCSKDIIAKNASFDKLTRTFCSKSCATAFKNKRKVWTIEERKILSEKCGERFRGKKKSNESRLRSSMAISGKKHWNWKGGITKEHFKERNNLLLKEWRRKVFERDNYTCQECFKRSRKGQSVKLSAHHVERWSNNPDLRYDINNGITLCSQCHEKTENYKGKGVVRPELHIPIVQLNYETKEIIKVFPSASAASRETGVLRTSISNNLKDRSKSAGGYIWAYCRS